MTKRIRKSQTPWTINVSFGHTAEGLPGAAMAFNSTAALADAIREHATRTPRRDKYRTDNEIYAAIKNAGRWLCHGTNAGDRQLGSFELVDFIQLDIDKAPAGSMSRVAAGLPFAYTIYQSTGFGLPLKNELECFRVIVPMTQGVNAAMLFSITSWLGDTVATVGGFDFACVDRASADINRIMYMPFTHGEVITREGTPVNPVNMLPMGYSAPWDFNDSGLVAGEHTEWKHFDELVSVLLSVDGASMTKRGRINMPSQSGREFSNGRNANDAWQFRGPSGEFTEIVLRSQHENTEHGMKAREAFSFIPGATEAYEAGLKARRPNTLLANFAGKGRAADGSGSDAACSDYRPVLNEDGFLSDEYDLERIDEAGNPKPWFSMREDRPRYEWHQATKTPLVFIAPYLKLRRNKDGVPTGTTIDNRAENLRWVLDCMGWYVTRNMMTWEIELYTWDNRRITSSEARTRSLIIGELSSRGVPEKAYADHLDGLAEERSYHPVANLLNGKEWDGVKRVDDVLQCVNAVNPEYATAVLRCTLNAAVHALSADTVNNRGIAMKACPVLYSKANDWKKSQFVQRLFDVLPGAFIGGLPVVNPTSKDSVRNAVFCWGGEFGELGNMNKVDTENLKAWIPLQSDKWRTEHKATFSIKPRQTVFIGTINRDDFIKDDSIASRFPVVELAGPVDIERMNSILGWKYDGSSARLVNAELLTQFWLEVKATLGSYIIPIELMEQVRRVGDAFEDKGSYYGALRDHIEMMREANRPDGCFTASTICEMFGVPVQQNVHMGRALNKLWHERVIDKKKIRGVTLYEMPGKAN